MTRFNLSRWAIEHPPLILFLMLLFSVMGAFAFTTLGRAEDPSFTIKDMIVTAQWPGASPSQMQSEIADPLERALSSVESLDYLSTYCVEGSCVTQVTLKDSTPKTLVPHIWQSVRNKIGDLAPDLPAGASLGANDDYADVYGYVFMLTGAENARLVQAAEAIRRQILRLPGAGKVEIGGELPQRIFVQFDPRRLAGMGMSAGQLARALAQQTAVEPVALPDYGLSVPVRVSGEPDGVRAIENTQLSTPSGPLRLGDIATVSRGYADPPPAFVRSAGQSAVALSVSMAPGSDGFAFANALHALTQRMATELPAGMHVVQIEDQSLHIREAVNTFLIKFFFALTVVLAIAFLTLGFRAGIVVALSVPLTLMIVALFMNASGIGLERVSLGALILSLGLLVDDAIISVEAMAVQMERGASRAEAAAYAWSHTAFPMLTGTLLTVAGFLPVGFAQSTTSEYTSGLFWVTGAALVVSWIVAVVFTPYLGVRLLPKIQHKPGHRDIYASPIYRRLRRIVDWCLTHRVLVTATTVALLMLSLIGTQFINLQFFPPSDRPELIADLAMRPGTSIAATERTVEDIEGQLKNDRDIAHMASFIGDGAPRFYLPYSPATPDDAHATLLIVARDLHARENLLARLNHLMITADASLHVTRLSLGPSAGLPVQFRVIGPDPGQLRSIADSIATVLRTTPGAVAVHVNWGGRIPVIKFDADSERLAALGTDRITLSSQIQALVNGEKAGDIPSGNKRIAIVVRADDADRRDAGQLADLPIETTKGFVPAGQLARITLAEEYPIMWSRNSQRAMTVGCDMAGNLQASQIMDRVEERIDAIRASLPAGYRIETGGDAELSDQANTAIFLLLPLTFAVMMTLLMLQLQSFTQAFLVLATAPLGLIGAVAALLVTGRPFGFVALLGLIALAGMIMRNAIILIDQVKQNERGGMIPRDAVMQATIGRARPVVLTALAAMLAFIPLCFNIFWGPMAIVLIGGMGGATALTLLALPPVCALAFDRPSRAPKEASDVLS